MSRTPNNRPLIFLADYKEGFGELARMVQEFEGITTESQELYLTYAERSLREQLELIDQKKTEVLTEVKEYLARYNSQFKVLLDTEKHLKGQLEYYKQIRVVIASDNGQRTEERAAI